MRAALLAGATLLFALTLGGAVWWGQQPLPDPASDRIQRSGVLRVGTDATYPPFESITDGAYVGYDMDLARSLAAGLGVRAEFVNIPLDGQYDALAQDQVDVLISALPFIYERQKEVRYSQAYYNSGPLLVVRAGDGRIGGPADLAGRTVGVELGSDADLAVRRLQAGGTALHLRATYHSTETALADLAAGALDAAVSDPLALAAYSRATSGAAGAALQALQPPLADEPYVIALRAPGPRLGPALDTLLAQMRADGRLGRMFTDAH